MRTLSVFVLGLGLTLAACGSDKKNPDGAVKKDGGTTGGDTGIVIPDGGSVLDKGGATGDKGATGTKFGEVCTPGPGACGANEACVTLQGSTSGKGFCTKQCPTAGQVTGCENGPAGTQAACILSVKDQAGNTSNACAFLCAIDDGKGGTTKFNCPSTMVCDPNPNPPTSKQQVCKVP